MQWRDEKKFHLEYEVKKKTYKQGTKEAKCYINY